MSKTNKNLTYKLIIPIRTPKGIRIPVCSVKGSCPRPLDDGGLCYRFLVISKAGNAIRTRDINLGKVALYH